MPCSDGRENTYPVYVESGKQTSRLCAVFTVLERQGILEKVLAQCDWTEAGVSHKSTVDWWARHKEEDRRRRIEERKRLEEKQEKERALNSALKKLTVQEAKALGLTRFGHKK